MATLKRDGQGGYVSPDGRWTVQPVQMGGGVTGWAGGRGWSNGHREWQLTDTHGLAKISQYGDPHSHIYDALWRVRDVIDFHHSKES